MSSQPYRALRPPHASPVTLQDSLQHLTDVRFIESPTLKGLHCRDMYGDLAYGLFAVRGATVRGSAGYIFTQSGVPIVEQNADFLRKGKFVAPRFQEIDPHSPPSTHVDEMVSLTSRRDTCFWHWMTDSLPKVTLAEDCEFRGTYLIPSPERAPWAAESLELLGVSSARILVNHEDTIGTSTLYVPSYFCGYNAHHNVPLITLFRNHMRASCGQGVTKPNSRIFIGRKPTSRFRRIINHDEVVQVLAPYGFNLVYFEDLSLRDQISLACTCEVMISAHGSGLTHSLFMDEASLVIELFPYQKRQSCDCYETLSLIPPHRYRSIESGCDRDGDIEVPGQTLAACLDQELSSSI